MIVLASHSTATNGFPREDEHQISFATKPQGKGGYYSTQVRIPRDIMSELGDPKRVAISGSPHEGFIIKPTSDKHDGYALDYKRSGVALAISIAFKPMKLTKTPRRMTSARARVVDGVIRVGGMPPGWIDGAAEFVEAAKGKATPAAPTPAPTQHRLPASPASGGTIAHNGAGNGNGNGNGHSVPAAATVPPPRRAIDKINDSVPIDHIKVRLDFALREASALRTALEQRTGLTFKISQDMRLILDLGEPAPTPSKA